MFKRVMIMRKLICGFLSSRNVHKYAAISELNFEKSEGKRSYVQGWVKGLRKMKEMVFLDVNDGSSSQHLQVVTEKSKLPANVNYGCSVKVDGQLYKLPNGNIELKAENIELVGDCSLSTYPFLPRKQYSQEYVRSHLYLRPRTRTFSSIMRLRDLANYEIREHLRNRGFIHVHTPILTSNDCEGAGETFLVKPSSIDEGDEAEEYFNVQTHLSVSGQLHLEACARALSKVYNFSPTFRAENSKSRLHLSEFYMVEAEIAFMSSLKELANEIELLIKTVTSNLLLKGELDLKSINAPDPSWLEKDFNYITYDEAVDFLENNCDKLSVAIIRGAALSKEHELLLVEEYGGVPTFVVEWPKDVKPFYMKNCSENKSKVLALDLLAPTVGEIVGGSVREDDLTILKKKLPKSVDLKWYTNLRKYGNVPTAGFGMGFERYLQFILGVPNIKDVIPFPRWPHHCTL